MTDINLESLLGFSYKSYNSKIIPTLRILEESEFDGDYKYKLEIIAKPTWGHTIGQLIRRVCLTSLPGIGVIGFFIDGASHIFSQVKGIKELTSDIALTLGELVLVPKEPLTLNKIYVLKIHKKGPGPVYAKELNSDEFKVLNENKIICHLDQGSELNMKILVTEGVGFRTSMDHTIENLSSTYFLIDTNFSFVTKCAFEVTEETSLKDSYDILNFTIHTKKPCDAKELVENIINILTNELRFLVNEQTIHEAPVCEPADRWADVKIESTTLSARTKGALLKANILTIKSLVNHTQEELQSLGGIGRTSLEDILKFIQEKDLSLKKNLGEL